MLIKVDEQKTDAFIHISEACIRLCCHRKKRKEISTHACMHVPPCAHRSSTTSQDFARAHYMCECVCCYYFANPSTVSVCLSVHVRPCVSPLQYQFVLKGGNTITHPHKHTHHGTHVILVIFWKVSDGTDVIPLDERSSEPPCVGQEPVRTSDAPA